VSAIQQPAAGDDVPRLERSPGRLPDWARAVVLAQLEALSKSERGFAAIDTTEWDVSLQVDHSLMGSALARVRSELEVNRAWKRNPLFYAPSAEIDTTGSATWSSRPES
jgi:hypothetical protein